jgi:TonB family protein
MERKALRGWLLFWLVFTTGTQSYPQVMQTRKFATELAGARALTAGATASDVAHHLHYDVTFHDRTGHAATATYDLYRDPGRFLRIDTVSGDYRYTHIEDLVNHRTWIHFTGDGPLKLLDLTDVLLEPTPEIYGFEHFSASPPPLQPAVVDDLLYNCADDKKAIRVCFDPFVRIFAFAQVYNQSVTYQNWLHIGSHVAAGKVQLYDDQKLLVEAIGKVERVQQFPPSLFEPGNEPSQSEDNGHHPIHMKAVKESPLYGNVEMQLQVDAEGKVTKAKVIDSDDKQLNHTAEKSARGMTYAPQMVNGVATPFTTIAFMHYFPAD